VRLTPFALRNATTLAGLAVLAASQMSHQFPIHNELRNSQQIRDEINALQTRVEAIRQDCESEKRDMTDEELSEVDAILGTGSPGAADFKPGKIEKLENALKQAKRIEDNAARIAAQRLADGQSNPQSPPAGGSLDVAPVAIIVPAQYRLGRTLQAFAGPNAEAQAYTAGRFYLAALFDHKESREWCAKHGIAIQAAQTGGVDTKGGFLIPTELATTIISYAFRYGRVLEYADVRRMSSDTLDVTKEVGDPEAAWMGATGAASERTAVPELDFDYASYRLLANKLGALTRISSELSEDAIIDIADNVTVRLARAAAKQLDKTGFLGTGNAASGGFTGILPALAAGSVYTPANGTLSYAAFTETMFNAIIGRVEEYADDDRCAWFVNKRFYTLAMAPIKDAAGGNDAMEISDGTGRRRLMFKGYPVVFCSIFPKTQGAIAAGTWLGGFGDLMQSLIVGLRRDIQIALSTERYFDTDELGVRLLMRGAIQAHDIGDATNGGAFIGIKAAAA
jgi:HK97 family phage major capsid protein